MWSTSALPVPRVSSSFSLGRGSGQGNQSLSRELRASALCPGLEKLTEVQDFYTRSHKHYLKT